jgi:hypothetical protein
MSQLQDAMQSLTEQLSEAVARRDRGLKRWDEDRETCGYKYPDVAGVSQIELNERVRDIALAISQLAEAASSAAKGGSLV